MKFNCRCEYIFVDQTDDLPYKGNIIPDQSYEDICAAIDVLIESEKPSDLLERDKMIAPIMNPKGERDIFQCPDCGRIHICGLGSRVFSFKPEDEDVPKNLLSNELIQTQD